MTPLALLALCGVLEAVIWLWRLRAGLGASAAASAWSTVGVCGTRVLFVGAGVGATLAGDIVVGGVVYVASAGLATWAAHAWAERWR